MYVNSNIISTCKMIFYFSKIKTIIKFIKLLQKKNKMCQVNRERARDKEEQALNEWIVL